MRLTRIVATLGPAALVPETLEELIRAGVDVFRCNFSHGSIEVHNNACQAVRATSQKVGHEVALLQDLCGPKIRAEKMTDGAVELINGKETIITTENILGTAERFSCSYKNLPRDVSAGSKILLDDGLLELEVVRTNGNDVHCLVKHGGTLRDRKGINLPNVKLSTPSVTEEDLKNLQAGEAIGFDYVALSFVRSADDILQVRRATANFKHQPLIIAKIEKPEAITCIDEIIEVADGIMIARGDLAVEISPEKVPLLQQDLIRRANAADKIVIVATQMLESMKDNFTPTRAEVNDVAIAVYEGADAVMLSAETSVGKYPVEAVNVMNRVAKEVEIHMAATGHPQWDWVRGRVSHPLGDAVSNAAYSIYETLNAKAIVAFTRSGHTALYLSKCRPFTHLIMFTNSQHTARKMRLFWGVKPVYEPEIQTTDELRYRAVGYLRENNLCANDDNIIIVSGSPFGKIDHSNTIEVTQLSGAAVAANRRKK